jgi:S-DNA-T family DNA segregation ATPase FtsK/SpoIIIE
VIGVASSTLRPFTIDPQGTFLVAGPPGSGRTTALLTIVAALRAWEQKVELHYLGNRRSPLAGLDGWRSAATTLDEIAELAGELTARLQSDGRTAPMAVIIEGVGDLVGDVAEMPLQDLLKVCLNEGVLVVVEGETTSLGATFGLLGMAKISRTGLVFGPDQGDGSTLFKTDFPLIVRSDFPAGRALYATLGHVEVVQIATP